MAKHIAIDLGASNGRVIVGDLSGFEVTNRFVTKSEILLKESHWDIIYIFSEIKKGIKEAFQRYGDQIVSIGVDTWGVDYGLLDEHGSLVAIPYHYRDLRSEGMIEEVTKKLGRDAIFERTGIAFQPFNTLYQLAAMQKLRPATFSVARHYLSLPDLINYWLTNVMVNEVTHASTTQLYNPNTKDWDWETIDALNFPRHIFGKLVLSGTIVGPLDAAVAQELHAPEHVVVVAGGTHDTASAVAAVPSASGEDFLYISSGTWSLLGVESKTPIVTPAALESGFTNEVAVNGNIRFLKNIMGMWIQQECVHYWEEQGESLSWAELDAETLECANYPGYIDPNDQRYLAQSTPQNLMVDRVVANCKELGFAPPKSKGEYMVAIYRGLAKAYAQAIMHLEQTTGKKYKSLYIIGGGCKNEILDQWSADETGLTVYAGPVEATALGNMLVQGVATGSIASLQEGRAQIIAHQKVTRFDPQ
ncbi:MAG: rhamnulokinase [Sphaerochaetaceae bacterium]|jgi:rhamnulokinase|nr:rhamnulokinase [Sphaerochaetaceae bacterium]MDD4219145.1 rhamnulokinase [Sphaerochaetaceae bacterium]MDY0370793.1 rhamnulokinase family protein [Sphaerochaetaceae bacterium]